MIYGLEEALYAMAMGDEYELLIEYDFMEFIVEFDELLSNLSKDITFST
jgi:hypothetical protein